MATILKIQENGSDVLNFNTGALTLESFVPAVPALLTNDYDLETDLEDALSFYAKAATRDALANALNEVDRILFNASLADTHDLVWQGDGVTTQVLTGLRGGRAARVGEIVTATDGQYVQRMSVSVVREPVWRGPWTTLTPDGASPSMTNDLTPYVILPALLGELPAPAELSVAVAGGNAASATRLLVSVKAVGANFNHLLQVETATYLLPALTTRTDTGFSPGTGNTAKRWAAANTDETLLARWDITSNLASYRAVFLSFVRGRENTTTKNYSLRMRNGVIAGGQYIPDAWGGDYVLVPRSNAASTNEELLVPTGILRVLKQDKRAVPTEGIYFELWGKALSASGSIDLDALELFALGESGGGLGCVAADFVAPFSLGRPAVSSRPSDPRAFSRDVTTGAYLVAAKRVEGGAVYLQPRITGQRVYFLITLDEASYFMHDRSCTLTFSGSYQPRFIHLPGTI